MVYIFIIELAYFGPIIKMVKFVTGYIKIRKFGKALCQNTENTKNELLSYRKEVLTVSAMTSGAEHIIARYFLKFQQL